MLKQYLICCILAAIAVWLVELGSMAIAHSSGGLGLLLLFCPGMLPVFLGVFENEYAGWICAAALTGAYYYFIWKFFVALNNR